MPHLDDFGFEPSPDDSRAFLEIVQAAELQKNREEEAYARLHEGAHYSSALAVKGALAGTAGLAVNAVELTEAIEEVPLAPTINEETAELSQGALIYGGFLLFAVGLAARIRISILRQDVKHNRGQFR